MKGQGIVRGSWVGTVVLGVGAVAGVAAPQSLAWLGFAVSLALFVAGCVVFVWAFAVAVGRRHESFTDPKLQAVLDEIELRAHVELAKLEQADMARQRIA